MLIKKNKKNGENSPNLKINYLYNLSYQILQFITPFITTPYISRVLGAKNIGICSYINANTIYFVLIGVFGLSTYSQFEVSKKRNDIDELSQFFLESLVTRWITMGVSILIFAIIFIFNSENTYQLFYMIQIVYLLSNAFDLSWVFQGLENFKVITMRNYIVKLLNIIAIFIFVKKQSDLGCYLLINAVAAVIGNLIMVPYAVQYLSFRNIKRLKIIKHLKATSMFFLPSVASVLIGTVDKLMLGWFTEDKLQNGYYEQATKIENILIVIFSSLNITMRPRMAYLFKEGKIEEIKEKMLLSIQFVLFLALPMAFGLNILASSFVPWFFGSEYKPVIALLEVISWWILIKAFSNCLIEQYIVPNEGQVIVTKIIWTGAIVNILLNALFIQDFGAMGAVVASLITEGVILILTCWKSRDVIDSKNFLKRVNKNFVAAVGMYLLLLILKKHIGSNIVGTGILLFSGIIIYFLILLILKDSFLRQVLNKNFLSGRSK